MSCVCVYEKHSGLSMHLRLLESSGAIPIPDGSSLAIKKGQACTMCSMSQRLLGGCLVNASFLHSKFWRCVMPVIFLTCGYLKNCALVTIEHYKIPAFSDTCLNKKILEWLSHKATTRLHPKENDNPLSIFPTDIYIEIWSVM